MNRPPTFSTPIIPVTALVDWNSQIHALALRNRVGELELADRTLAYVGRVVAKALYDISGDLRFDVTLRIYSGWHQGFQIVPRRRALTTSGAQSPPLSNKMNVNIRPNLEFGDRLVSGLQSRLHPRLNIHLANTLRPSIRDKDRLEEKMVDTAIASDLVDLAHRDRERWLLVLGEDDDLIPPLLVANGIRNNIEGRIAIIRRRLETPFLKFNDLRICP